MKVPSPGKLFHAVVLVGASLGAACTSQEPAPRQPVADASIDVAVGDAHASVDFINPDSAESPDAECDVASCPVNYYLQNCTCVIGIL